LDQQDNYWIRKWANRSVARRRFLVGGALGAVGAASIGLVGCGDDDDNTGGGGGQGSPSTSATSTPAAAQPVKGGIARFTSANNTWDTFDIDRSIFSTTAAYVLDLDNLGIVHYDNFAQAKVGGGFAQSWEQPSPTQMTFKLRDGLFWQNKAPVNGRAATAKDMAEHILRNRDNKLRDGTVDKSTFYRGSQYALVESATTPDDKTLVVKFSSPNIFFLDTLANSYAKVQAPEAIDKFEKEYNKLQADQIVGTGPFELVDFKAEGTLNHKRFEKFPSPALLDGLRFLPLFDQAAGQAAFEQKQIDAFTPAKKAVLDDLMKRFDKQVNNNITFSANGGLVLTNGEGPPWNNPALNQAVSRMIDRRAFVSQLLQGLGGIWGNINPAQAPFSIKESELITLPGYLEDHAKDVADAKKLWDANGGPGLGTIHLDLPDVLELALPGYTDLWVKQFNQLGNKVETNIVPFSTIISKINALQYGNSAKPGGGANIYIGVTSDVAGPEPTLSNYQNYHSSQPRAKIYGPGNAETDRITLAAFNEPDVEKRKQLSMDFQRNVVKAGGQGLITTFIGFNNTLVWNYLKVPEFATFLTQHQWNRMWIDTKDPSFSSRPA
jgi:ABC-type transport system substrate-binding protein